MHYAMSCNAIKQNKRYRRERKLQNRKTETLALQIFQPIMAGFGRWAKKSMAYLWMSESGDDSAPLCSALIGLSVMTKSTIRLADITFVTP